MSRAADLKSALATPLSWPSEDGGRPEALRPALSVQFAVSCRDGRHLIMDISGDSNIRYVCSLFSGKEKCRKRGRKYTMACQRSVVMAAPLSSSLVSDPRPEALRPALSVQFAFILRIQGEQGFPAPVWFPADRKSGFRTE